MIRWFIIVLETAALAYLLLKSQEFNLLLRQLLNAIPSSQELKIWLLKGANSGAYLTIFFLGIALTSLILYCLVPYVKTLLDKEALVEKWEREFIEAKQVEINEIKKLEQEVQKELREVQNRDQELRQQITYYQHLSHQLKRKEVELEIEFQQKRESYLQELDGLQRKNRELQARIKRLKEQLKSCREKLKKEV